jgi:hypothetical protein
MIKSNIKRFNRKKKKIGRSFFLKKKKKNKGNSFTIHMNSKGVRLIPIILVGLG